MYSTVIPAETNTDDIRLILLIDNWKTWERKMTIRNIYKSLN